MDNFGNFERKYVAEVVVKDNDGKDVCIKLKYTAMTPLLYMNYFGIDMFDDLANIVINGSKQDELLQKVHNEGVESLSDDEINKVSTDYTLAFFDKFAVALIATALYPESLSYARIRSTMLPEDFIADERYSDIFNAIYELFNPAVEDYKKKLIRLQITAKGKK